MSQWVRALAALAEVLSSVPSICISIHSGQLTTAYSRSRGSDALFWSSEALQAHSTPITYNPGAHKYT